MICPDCERRWAPFPKEDFSYKAGDIIPKNQTAEEKRGQVFDSDDREYCGCNEDKPTIPYPTIPYFR